MFLSVPVRLLHMNDEERTYLAAQVAHARTRLGLSKEAAAKAGGVTTTTWRRVESGQRVQDHKLESILAAVGLTTDSGSEEIYPTEMWSDVVFVLPPEIENGYLDVVGFAKAVQDECPPLANRATRLMIDAAGLFSAAGDFLLARQGGETHAEASNGGEPDQGSTTRSDYELIAHDEEHAIEEEQIEENP